MGSTPAAAAVVVFVATEVAVAVARLVWRSELPREPLTAEQSAYSSLDTVDRVLDVLVVVTVVELVDG